MSFLQSKIIRGTLLAASVAIAAGCGGDSATSPSGTQAGSDPTTATYASSLGVNIAAMTKLSDDLYMQDQIVGTGAVAADGHNISVTYTGWLTNGTQFDSNVGAATPFSFVLGEGQVIPGWDFGVAGMRVGGKRLLVMGSGLAYGPNTYGSIPGGSTLVFTVQLVAVQ